MRAVVLLSLAFCAARLMSEEYGKPTSSKVVDGVYLFRTTGYGDAGLAGNVTAIVGNDGVLVFDSTGTPKSAQMIIAEIRTMTDKPVRYLVNSHWHWDHWGGNQAFKQAYPMVEIISYQKNIQQMRDVSVPRNQQSIKDLDGFLPQIEQAIARKKAEHAPAEQIQRMEDALAADKDFTEQKRTLTNTYPNVVFSDELTVFLGGRDVKVLHAKGITPGDTYLFLPNERVLVTGDIAIDPFPFAIGGSYPATWVETLQKMIAMDPAWVIPGHGKAQAGTAFLKKELAMFQNVMRQVKESKSKGLTVEQTVDAVVAKNGEFAGEMGIQDTDVSQQFKLYFLNIFAKRAYQELDHPLDEEKPGS